MDHPGQPRAPISALLLLRYHEKGQGALESWEGALLFPHLLHCGDTYIPHLNHLPRALSSALLPDHSFCNRQIWAAPSSVPTAAFCPLCGLPASLKPLTLLQDKTTSTLILFPFRGPKHAPKHSPQCQGGSCSSSRRSGRYSLQQPPSNTVLAAGQLSLPAPFLPQPLHTRHADSRLLQNKPRASVNTQLSAQTHTDPGTRS